MFNCLLTTAKYQARAFTRTHGPISTITRFQCVKEALAPSQKNSWSTVTDDPFPPVHQEDVPLPYAGNLEKLSLPGTADIVKAAKAVCYAE